MSLDALDIETLQKMWVYRKVEDVLRNLLVLRELATEMRVKLMVNTVIQPGGIAAARDFLDFANDLGIWFCPVPMNTGPTINGALHQDPEYRGLTDLILARKREGYRISGSRRMNERLLSSAPLDCRNTLKPHVNFDGTLVWPCKATVDVDPIHVDVLNYPNVDALYEDASRMISPTQFQRRCGASCNWAQNYTTDAYVHGLRHPTSLAGEVVEFLRAGS